MFCHLILSFVCAHIGPGLSVYVAHVHTLSTQVSGRPGLDNEVGFIGCPCALGFFLTSTTHTHLCPVSSSFSCLHPFVFAARTLSQPS